MLKKKKEEKKRSHIKDTNAHHIQWKCPTNTIYQGPIHNDTQHEIRSTKPGYLNYEAKQFWCGFMCHLSLYF